MRVGIIGYGLGGRVFHGRLLAAVPHVRVTDVVTRDPARRAAAVADHPGVTCHDSIDGLLAARPDLAVVASPDAYHAEGALACISAGVPVVVDKPLAPTAAEARRVVRAAESAGVPLTVFHNRRWDADQLTLRRLLAAGDLGDVLRYESRFERWRPALTPGKWRDTDPTGGLLTDLGSHLVDQAVTLFGPPTAVYAEVDARRGGAIDDVFLALTHPGGVYAHLWFGALAGAPGPRLRVLGTGGALVIEGLDGQEEALRAGRPAGAVAEPPARLQRGDDVEAVAVDSGRWPDFYPAVLAALRGGGPMPVEPWDAVRVLEILDAARGVAADRLAASFSMGAAGDG